MALTCELCGRKSPDRSARCECGYEFATGSVGTSVESAIADRGRVNVRVAFGMAAMVVGVLGAWSIPQLFAHLDSDLAAITLWLLRFVFIALGLTGLVYALFSLRGSARTRRILRAARARRQDLPEARLVNPPDE